MDTIQWISINKEVRICRLRICWRLAVLGADDWTAHFLCLCLQVYRGRGIQRYVNWCRYVIQITCPILLPYFFNEYPIGLYIMDKVCVWKPLSKQFFKFTFTTKSYEFCCVHLLLIIYIMSFGGGNSQTLPFLYLNITGNLFNHHALQNHSGYGYGDHQDININTPEDKPIGLWALLGVYLIFRMFNCALPLKS